MDGKKESVLVSGADDVVHRNGVPQVPSALPSESSSHNGLQPPLLEPPNMDTSTAERVGQIISSQTSLSKELQSKLPRAGESIGGSGIGAESRKDKPAEVDTAEAVVSEDLNTGKGSDVDLAGQPSSESFGTSVDVENTGTLDITAIATPTVSTELHDLPQEFSKEWKEAREEEQRRDEEEREERSNVRNVRVHA